MAASESFRSAWGEFESALISVPSAGAAARAPLRKLLEKLPVGHVDKASAFRLDSDMPLLELCAFSVVAASVEKNFPEAADWVSSARGVLSSPTREQRKRMTGSAEDLDAFFEWLEAGRPADRVLRGPAVDETPDLSPSMFEWLEMMSKAHACNSKGDPASSPLEEWADDEVDDADAENAEQDMGKDEEEPLTVQSAYLPGDDGVEGGMVGNTFSSSDAEVDACYEEWLTSAVAAKLKEFLDRELPA
jgi:hypothetical protein